MENKELKKGDKVLLMKYSGTYAIPFTDFKKKYVDTIATYIGSVRNAIKNYSLVKSGDATFIWKTSCLRLVKVFNEEEKEEILNRAKELIMGHGVILSATEIEPTEIEPTFMGYGEIVYEEGVPILKISDTPPSTSSEALNPDEIELKNYQLTLSMETAKNILDKPSAFIMALEEEIRNSIPFPQFNTAVNTNDVFGVLKELKRIEREINSKPSLYSRTVFKEMEYMVYIGRNFSNETVIHSRINDGSSMFVLPSKDLADIFISKYISYIHQIYRELY